MKSSLFHAVVVMGASLSACAETQAVPAAPRATKPSEPLVTPVDPRPIENAGDGENFGENLGESEQRAATPAERAAGAEPARQDSKAAPAPAVKRGTVQTPDSVEPAKIPADPQPPSSAAHKKKAAEPCPPHSESPYPPCWMIL